MGAFTYDNGNAVVDTFRTHDLEGLIGGSSGAHRSQRLLICHWWSEASGLVTERLPVQIPPYPDSHSWVLKQVPQPLNCSPTSYVPNSVL